MTQALSYQRAAERWQTFAPTAVQREAMVDCVDALYAKVAALARASTQR